jgi:HK97 family phage major capsid protein
MLFVTHRAITPGGELKRVEDTTTTTNPTPETAAAKAFGIGRGRRVGRMRGEMKTAGALEDFGFRSLEEFAAELKAMAASVGRQMTPRLRRYAGDVKSMGLDEFSDANGAVLVPPAFADGIWTVAMERRSSPLAWCLQSTTRGNAYVRNAWQDRSKVAGSRFGGVRAYRVEEGTQLTKSKPQLRRIEHKLNKLVVMVVATDELVEDSPGFEESLARVCGAEVAFAIGEEMIQGTGAGTCLGVLNAPGTITVAAESGQGANTIVGANLTSMWSALDPDCRTRAVWLLAPEADDQIHQTNLQAAVPITYASPGEVEAGAAPYTIFGRPAFPSFHCSALGSKGDVVLGDWSTYEHVVKEGHPKFTSSIHAYFATDESAFKFGIRNDGRPLADATKAPVRGSAVFGSFVTLSATRT